MQLVGLRFPGLFTRGIIKTIRNVPVLCEATQRQLTQPKTSTLHLLGLSVFRRKNASNHRFCVIACSGFDQDGIIRQETVRNTPISQFIHPGKYFLMYNFCVLMFMITLTGKCNSRKAINLTKIGQMTEKAYGILTPRLPQTNFVFTPWSCDIVQYTHDLDLIQ